MCFGLFLAKEEFFFFVLFFVLLVCKKQDFWACPPFCDSDDLIASVVDLSWSKSRKETHSKQF